MQAGKLRHRLAIQSETRTPNTFGEQPITSWSTDGTVWGRVEPLSGKELLQAKEIHPEVTHRITVRGGTAITAANQILYDSREFAILSVLDLEERDIELRILCKEQP